MCGIKDIVPQNPHHCEENKIYEHKLGILDCFHDINFTYEFLCLPVDRRNVTLTSS